MKLKKILLVDDDEGEQYLYKTVISQHDPSVEIVSAFDGEEALEYVDFKNNEFDLILLDINMPRMNGFEFLDKYIEKYRKNGARITMLTSSILKSDRDKALSYDCVNDCILKPLSISDIEKICTEH